MKKSIIIVGVFLLLIALLPILGNSFMKRTIDEQIIKLKEYGITTKKDEVNSSYLSSVRHVEFVFEDSQKFITNMSSFSDRQSPIDVSPLFNGLVFGIDIKYSNLLFAKTYEMEIYPLDLSGDIKELLLQNNADFLAYLEKFFHAKGVVYHISYNAINSNFNGYIKDIKQNFTLKDGTKIDIELSNALFDGEGELIAPDKINSKIKAFHLNIVKDKEIFITSLEKFSSSVKFDKKKAYLHSLAVDTIDMNFHVRGDAVELHTKELKLTTASNTDEKTTELNAKCSFNLFNLKSKKVMVDLRGFDFDGAVNDLDAKKYKLVRKLIAQKKNQPVLIENKELKEAIVALVSKGFLINIANVSLKDITLDKQTQLKGFKLKSKLVFAADKELAQKIQFSPVMIGSDLEITTEFKIAKELYAYLTTKSKMFATTLAYAKEENGNVLFNIKVKDAKVTINEKQLN